MKEIKLTQGKVALVDDDMYEFINQFKWYAYKDKLGTFYARRGCVIDGNLATIGMHRLIMGISDPNILVDHKNGDGLRNLKENLRVASRSQNGANRVSSKNGSSKYIGVSWQNKAEKWQANIKKNSKQKYIGLFSNEEDAARAYNEMAIVIHGDFARLNTICDQNNNSILIEANN